MAVKGPSAPGWDRKLAARDIRLIADAPVLNIIGFRMSPAGPNRTHGCMDTPIAVLDHPRSFTGIIDLEVDGQDRLGTRLFTQL